MDHFPKASLDNSFPNKTPESFDLVGTTSHDENLFFQPNIFTSTQPVLGSNLSVPCNPDNSQQDFTYTLDPVAAHQVNPPSLRLRHPCYCAKSYNRKGDLKRHVTTAHLNPSSFLCHFDHCPRGITGNGFARKDKLTNHLTSKKHGMSKVDAVFEADLHYRRT
jgi:hypothetical protein